MSNGHGDRDGEPTLPAPFVFIPYHATDDGTRPLPPQIALWECPGIKLDGVPRSVHGPLVLGREIGLSADVANYGILGSIVTVSFFWGDPSTAFSGQLLNPIGTFSEYRAAGQLAETQSMKWLPDANVPAHACLVAEVAAPFDPPSGSFSPLDRHYAQQNLQFITVAADASMLETRFKVANPWSRRKSVQLRVRNVSQSGNSPDQEQAKDVALDLMKATIRTEKWGSMASPFIFDVEAGESMLCELEIPLSIRVSGRTMSLAVEQTDPENDDLIVGALGLVVRGT